MASPKYANNEKTVKRSLKVVFAANSAQTLAHKITSIMQLPLAYRQIKCPRFSQHI